MRVPLPPPDFGAHGPAFAHVSRGGRAASATGAPGADVAQAMGVLSGGTPGHADGIDVRTQLAGRVSQALSSADVPADLPALQMRCARATSLARLFAGESACP